MKNIILATWLLCLLLACKRDLEKGAAESTIQLLCEYMESANETPHFGVYMIVDAIKTKVMEVPTGCTEIAPDAYDKFAIPANALSATGGRWPGGGDYFYALREASGRVVVYHTAVHEDRAMARYAYVPIAVYENGRIQVEIPAFNEK
ncbi:MAG TPA: hypothetical protein PKC76_07230 [Saprospiraceae bacterium]|nr:hypothetical protein [Saprospiraceae bacterium]HMP23904.1 hypothetical protein [Saprospiraceae bacterium]